MLSSKRIGIISFALIVIVLAVVAYILMNPPKQNENYGAVTYENGQSIEFTDSDYYSDYTARSHQKISLGDEDITITSGGVYELSGKLSGSVTVDAEGGGVVELVLNGAHITADEGSGIYVNQASKTVIALAPGSENTITDSDSRADITVSGAIYSRDDLVICGEGTLDVNANFADGIKANDSLKITGGNINITSADEGINVNDYAAFMGGTVSINSGGHGIKCENTEDSSLGFVVIDGTILNIESENDGIQAGGDIYVNYTEAVISVKDDGIHSDSTLYLNGGNVEVTACTEGFEGKYIVVNDGEYNITASDDGLNASGEGSMMPEGFGGGGEITAEVYLTVNGGKLYAKVDGDGLDSNGAAIINGGYLEVYGPENNGNSTLDFDGGFEINGGTVLAAGASGMAESPTESSEQNTVVVYLEETYDADISFALWDKNSVKIAEGTSEKRFDWLCISSDKIKTGETYTLTVGDNTVENVEISASVTTVGERSGFGGGPQMNRGGNFQ